jgi:uncharacterized protein (DUF302 family)
MLGLGCAVGEPDVDLRWPMRRLAYPTSRDCPDLSAGRKLDAAYPGGYPEFMSYGNSVTLASEFDDVVEQVRSALADQGFGVITEIDVQTTMQEKLGEKYDPYLILGACNPSLAHRAIQTDEAIGMLLPCNVVVRRVGSETVVEALDPQIMVQATGVSELAPVADEAASRLEAVLASLS